MFLKTLKKEIKIYFLFMCVYVNSRENVVTNLIENILIFIITLPPTEHSTGVSDLVFEVYLHVYV